jgi:hypothetical protein
MRLTVPSLLLALSGLHAALAQSCTLAALGSGKDDSPQFLTAMQACSTVVVPAGTTLNISTRLNMTGLSNKHLVGVLKLLSPDYLCVCCRACQGHFDSTRTSPIGLP